MSRIHDFEGFLNEKMALIDYDRYAELVVEAYMAAPDYDESALKHWDSLAESSNMWKRRMMSDIRIEYAPEEVYEDATDMRNRVFAEKVMYVSEEFTNHRYWSDEQYRCFRAVHDYIVHCEGNTDFTLRGEMKAINLHMRIVPEMAKPALFMEIAGNVCNKIVTDEFPEQIKIAVLEGFDYNQIGKVNREGYNVDKKRLIEPD